MDQPADESRAIAAIASWLIADARLRCAPLELIEGFCQRLLALGVPLGRLRAGQALANPLARETQAGVLTEAQLAHHVVNGLTADIEGDLAHADVGRVLITGATHLGDI